MLTDTIYTYMDGYRGELGTAFKEPTLVIGVRDQLHYDLDELLQKFPQLDVVHRFKDSINPKYLYGGLLEDNPHWLQAAILQVRPTPVEAPPVKKASRKPVVKE